LRSIKRLEINDSKNRPNLDVYFIEITFFEEEYERRFLHDVAKSFHNQFIASSLIYDLDVSVELYKEYFSMSNYSILKHDPTHPYIMGSVLNMQEIKSIIDNFGYYSLDAYLYWSKDKIDFQKVLPQTSDYFFTDCSELTIRQILDLSLEIQVKNKAVFNLWDILKKWSLT